MSKHGMGGHPPSVKVTGNSGKSKIVGLNNKPVNPEDTQKEEQPEHSDKGVDAPIDPRLTCLGRFALPQKLMYEALDDIASLMKDVIVTRCELLPTQNGNIFAYTAISDKYFKPLKHGARIPEYTVSKRMDGLLVVQEAPVVGMAQPRT